MIHNIDIGIIIAYFVIVLGIGLWVARKTETGEDLFLGGRSFGWGLIGLSLFASNISSSTIIGLSGAAYSTGIVQSVFEWMSGLPLIIAALIFIPLYLKSRITTIPEFLELRYDRRSRSFFSAVTIFTSIVVDTAGGLYAGAIVLQAFFPNLVMWQTTLVLALVAGLYTAFGGLKAVVITDAIQAVILIVGCSILTYLLFERLDFSWSNVIAAAPEGHLSIVRPIDDASLPWPGLILGVPFLGFWYWTTNQYIVQRVLGAKDIQNARWGVMLAGFLKIVPLFVMVIPGVMAISLFPGLDNGDSVFPTAVMNVLPVGLVGLVLAGLISAIMSSVDSTLNSASTLVVIDFVKTRNENITDKEVANYGRMTTLILMVIAAVWAPMIANFGGLWSYLQQMFAIIVPPIVVIFLVGVFYKKGNGDGAFKTLVYGTLAGVLLFILGQMEIWTLHFTINVGLMVILSTAMFIFFSNTSKSGGLKDMPQKAFSNALDGDLMAIEDETTHQVTFTRDLLEPQNPNTPWYLDYRVQSAVLVALMAYILIIFW